MSLLDNGDILASIGEFLAEDIGRGDITTQACVSGDVSAIGRFLAKENLVVCTLKERQRLLPKNRKKSSSAYRGVSYSQADGKWRAGIEVEGKAINLGHFDWEDEAAHAYNQAARKFFGNIAYQNNIKRVRRRTLDKNG